MTVAKDQIFNIKAMIADGRLVKGVFVNRKQVYNLDRKKLGMPE
jgi:hypothetical protein